MLVAGVSHIAMELIGAVAAARTPAEVGRSFFAALAPFGPRALFCRKLGAPTPTDEVVYARISPPGWEALYDEKRFDGVDFLTREVRNRVAPFDWSEITYASQAERDLADVLTDFRIEGGVCAPVHGPRGYVGVTSLALERSGQVSPQERQAIKMAALIAHLQMMARAGPAAAAGPRLSPRELDCLRFVAEGRTDWEIAEILGVAETTVLTHVQNARRKLGARSRAHAVAICVHAGLV